MPPLSPREELLRLHRQIYTKNKKVIAHSVITRDKSFSSYERRYLNSVSDYLKIATVREVEEAMLEAQIIYVGDYHTLNQSQRSFLRVLRSFVRKWKNFCIALEIIQWRHQGWLDRYVAGRLSEQTFLKKVGFQEHWFFDFWENFRPLFDFSHYHQIPLYGIEVDQKLGPTLHDRDASWAKRLFEIYQSRPDRKIFVFVGDLHIAPRHLPHEVRRIFNEKKIPVKTVTLYQNSESIYWRLAERELEQEVLVVKTSENEFCRMHTPPIICQQSYLNWLEHEEGELDFSDAKQTFLGFLNQIARFLGITLGPEADEVEVFTCGDLSFLHRLKDAKVFSPHELREIKRQILRSESYYIPKKKFVYLANVSVNHAAEEAAHTLRHLCAGEEFPRPMQDAFYANIIHEALGFYGSKVVNHRRKCLRPADCRRLLSSVSKIGEHEGGELRIQITRAFLDHERGVEAGKSFHPNKITSLSVDLFLGLTHAIGYFLGEKIFYGHMYGQLTKEYLRQLFYHEMEEDGEPVRVYFELDRLLKRVKLPKKV